MKTMLIAILVAVLIAFVNHTRAHGQDKQAEESLAWIKRVDGELKKPRYAKLTLDEGLI